MKRRIDEIRKKSAHELAELLEEIATVESGCTTCPICVGCSRAKREGWDCVKAREEYLKGRVQDGLLQI